MNYSDLTRKNLLYIVVKSVDLGKFSQVGRDDEVSVRIQWGNYHTRTSYLSPNNDSVAFNELFVIDLNNDQLQEINMYVDKIGKNDFSQAHKETIDPDTLAIRDVDKKFWPTKERNLEIDTLSIERKKTDIVIGVKAYIADINPTRGTKGC